jgi:adenylosuccinate lyase
VPTQFAGMSGLVKTLQSVQAESQLRDIGLIDQVAALTTLLERLGSEPRQYQFEGITEIAQMFNSVNYEQLLTETGLDTKLADITQQLEKLTDKVPTQFKGMSGLVTTLQSVQAESQLLDVRLIDQVAALTKQLERFSSDPRQHKFEGMTEIAQMLCQHQTQTSLSDTLSEIAELALKLERQDALASLAQTVHSFNAQQQFQSSAC